MFRIQCPVLLAGVSLAALPLAVSAQSAPESDALDPIVVTATLGPKTVGESLSSVTVIEKEDIDRQQPAEFRDLLRAQPGINVVSDGSYGKTTSVFLRGAGAQVQCCFSMVSDCALPLQASRPGSFCLRN